MRNSFPLCTRRETCTCRRRSAKEKGAELNPKRGRGLSRVLGVQWSWGVAGACFCLGPTAECVTEIHCKKDSSVSLRLWLVLSAIVLIFLHANCFFNECGASRFASVCFTCHSYRWVAYSEEQLEFPGEYNSELIGNRIVNFTAQAQTVKVLKPHSVTPLALHF